MNNFTKKILLTVTLLTVVSFGVSAQTNVSGGIYANTTWTKANSPYIVTDTVVVFPGVTLTIEPGVTVKFDDKLYLEIRQASLIALGTATDSITFTSNSATPTPGIWASVTLTGAIDGKFNYCKFNYANKGILGNMSGNNFLKNSNFNYNHYGISASFTYIDSSNFSNNQYGVYIGSGNGALKNCLFNNNMVGFQSYYTNINIDSCIFTNNSNTGILADVDNGNLVNLNYCFFYSNNIGFNGVKMNGTNFNNGYVTIKNCIYKYNNSAILKGDNVYWTSISVDNCNISNNQKGLYNIDKLTNSIIDSNSIFGIYAYSITNCQIKYNGTGIYYSYGNNLTQNIIENNNFGIKLTGGYVANAIYCNKICNNTSYDFYDSTGTSISIPNNYWCTTDSATIASHIYDGYDNINLGLVTFFPIDTTQCYLTGCNLQVSATVTNATCDTCHNGSATGQVANGFPPYTWTWYSSPMQSTQTATGLAAGYYTLCVTDSKGCSACKNNIFIDSTNCTGFSINASANNASCSACNDGKAWVNVYGGTSPYHYTWYTVPMQATDTAFGLSQGMYHVCVTDLYGCVACDSVAVSVGSCSAYFFLYPDTTTPHHYYAVNMASGTAPLTYTWNWGDSTTSTGPYPSHTYSNAGFYTICLTIVDSAGCTNTYCNSFYLQKNTNTMITVDVVSHIITGINEYYSGNSFYIFPNPAANNLTLMLSQNPSKAAVKIYNLLGELISSKMASNPKTNIDISGLSGGVYIIEVSTDKNINRQKFIKE